MPCLNLKFLESLQDDYKKYPCFIETGTFNGDTTFAIEPLFKEIYTIEFTEKYFINTQKRYTGNKINFILGDSSIIFKSLLPLIEDKCIFFLDGHYMSGFTNRSEKECPLNEEIDCINTLFKHEAIIIIDDFRLFGLKKNEDWSDISKDNLLRILHPRINKVYHLDSECAVDDRLVIHINSI
jgi:hypothetical protein